MDKITTEIDLNLDLSIALVKGLVWAEDIVRWQNEYYSGRVTTMVLMDFSEADLSKMSSNDFSLLAKALKENGRKRPEGKTALVMRKEVNYGIGRMFSSLSDIEDIVIQFDVFRDTVEARLWLGV